MFSTTAECVEFLESEGQLIRIKEEVDPYLEMAVIQRFVYQRQGPALLFENIKNCKYKAVSNIFGTLERCHLLFRKNIPSVLQLATIRKDPSMILKHPFSNVKLLSSAIHALPKQISTAKFKQNYKEISITEIPHIQCWKDDGGSFLTLPQVFTMDPTGKSILKDSNVGMYRIQLDGNAYESEKEIGLHYQTHRGIGIHHQKSIAKNQPLKVSIFVGGNPANTVAAVMPLPEGLSELTFAGVLGGERYKYYNDDGFIVNAQADFIIEGELDTATKPEGPFGDHFGYYSLAHPFPVLHVKKVYARNNAIYPFTVVGRPPQEDTSFGAFIHELTGKAIPSEMPGVKEVHAVDEAGVHPLLLAIGTERYTPYQKDKKPEEIITQALRILGTGQLSLAKYLIIAADSDGLTTHDIPAFFSYVLERIHLDRDLHFITNTTIDTLDYSGEGLNKGSKLIISICGDKKRDLASENLANWHSTAFPHLSLFAPGILIVSGIDFESYEMAETQFQNFVHYLVNHSNDLESYPLLVVVDDIKRVGNSWKNFLWETFTKSNPAKDIYGFESAYTFKHWQCSALMIIDARTKPHHAPALIEDVNALKIIERLTQKGGSLEQFKV